MAESVGQALVIRIEGRDLPGRTCGPSPEIPDGHANIHVAVQGRRGQSDLIGLTPADALSAVWELPCRAVGSSAPSGRLDIRGPGVQGGPGDRFIYLSWGTVDTEGRFAMFRRAKLRLGNVPGSVLEDAASRGVLVGRLGLTDARGNPRCADVGSDIEWSAASG